ncbi:MAG: menaquinone biosynthetic enzyme MqnA/MqnD family protein [Caldimicrobium sp.]
MKESLSKIKAQEEDTLNVGFPSYLNTLPFLYHLIITPEIKLYLVPPRKVNEALISGTLDLGLASSLFYAKNHSQYLLIPDLSISAVGKVKSVILYHNLPIEELHDKIIGITPEAETSFGLLRLILEDFYKVYPNYQVLPQTLEKNAFKSEESLVGYLAIGDEALTLHKKGLFLYYTDLAQIWLEKTNMPFVFALMVMKRVLSDKKLALLKNFLKDLYLSRAKGLASLSTIVENSSLDIDKTFALNYLQHIEYDFSGVKQRAFLYFCELLYKKGILKDIPVLEFFEI